MLVFNWVVFVACIVLHVLFWPPYFVLLDRNKFPWNENKRPILFFPGIVNAMSLITGAMVADITKVLWLYPVLVFGLPLVALVSMVLSCLVDNWSKD